MFMLGAFVLFGSIAAWVFHHFLEMSYKEAPLFESISPNNLPKLTHEAHGFGDSIKPPKFVNHGLFLWNQERQKWRGSKRAVTLSKKPRMPKLGNFCLCISKRFCCGGTAAYDKLLRKSKPFPRPIPLSEMVGFVVDIWEQEGLYD
ncbi:lipases [Striga asiatica]|uniref:Lipases n=1 Tax=Striga asiatica TaxID=4170 RepID=A0A5A7QT93_STRAF|nr:lipases [Striga asiatica]